MTQKEIFLEQLGTCHDKNGWFVAMNGALNGLTAEQAARDSDNGAHSVWQIVNHLIFWNERYLLRFKEQSPAEAGDNDSTFEGESAEAGESDWQRTRERFDAVMVKWKNALREAEESKLAGPVRKDSTVSWHAALSNMAIHTAYHIGQIVTLRKKQGSWDPKQGVS